MSRTRSSTPVVQDDALQISGWVFADLLLSLTVIFLVSISFTIPEKTGIGSIANSQGQNQNNFQNPTLGDRAPTNQGVNFYYSAFDRETLISDLQEYFFREKLDPNTDVIYAQVVGGFDTTFEGSELGTFRALEFSIALKQADIAAFSKANFDLTTSSQLAPDQVALRLSFAPPLALNR
jgi:hypothetical protein